ncbi:MAG: hydrogenase maturation nickel metallochaperone HypA [Ilumatobacteraceae bacterium]
MHELSVALRIREVLETELAGDGVEVDLVRIEVGALANIVPEALEFAWPHAVSDSTLLGASKIEIDWVEARLRCADCSATHTTPNLTSLRCPVCRSGRVEVIEGEQMDIIDVDVRERSTAGPP